MKDDHPQSALTPGSQKPASVREWVTGLWGLPRLQHPAASPGLVMIQIDGLGLSVLRKAIERDEMPFLSKLLASRQYEQYLFFPGLPSTTPSVQGELFYGVKQAVPAFFFYDREKGQVFKMFDGDSVREIERRLAGQCQGLLDGGSSYSNIYTGGAQEAHFCAASLGWDKIWKEINVMNCMALFLTHLFAVIRMILLTLWEGVLALMDLIYGLWKREDPQVEFKFVPIRILLCLLLRELIVLGAAIDAARGLPVIHLNFLGYDEQAHRRGPDSRTAHWALKGIDAAIARVFRAAARSSCRSYRVWVYSDHGQEKTTPYIGKYGRSAEEVITELFAQMFSDSTIVPVAGQPSKDQMRGVQYQRVRYFGKWIEKFWPSKHQAAVDPRQPCVVAAMGPLGHVYVFRDLRWEEKERFARALVQTANIPTVVMRDERDRVIVHNEKGRFELPQDACEILNAGDPQFADLVSDLVTLCHHPNAGTFVICGWRKDGELLSFPFENGAHAGPGPGETGAFALLPQDTFDVPPRQGYIRTKELREAALSYLRR